ncbi:hypothetical protein HMPREF1531_00975 [Propionibacterium sp. oral taxon 192 str. F0372]|uniref:beta-ketoacyl synthase N-terminal-like domain-containing protein n=1 Tax=Propionibacterium sp. oral taxon 192 TaxID=671222 RepID=UPI0003537CE0|nr:beta-ketoacyl synthase N-terminal-like domain-containing protein [Propionibacterium sp. oral taxon 192]EPH05546.1 hypothetical protein HMPREF1531_00975 [Propionibacterium sp. oral taxon 192 str. F0372]
MKDLGLLAHAVLLPQEGVLTDAHLTAPLAPVEIDFRTRLGRKGLRYSTPATLLAEAAAVEAMACRCPDDDCPPERLGLIASSRYGNAESVVNAAQIVIKQGADALSPMGLPNASSNVLASTVAIQLGIKGVCLTIEDERDRAASALQWAQVLITGGRCEQVLVVAAESDSPTARWLAGGRPVVTGGVALLVAAIDDRHSRSPMVARRWPLQPARMELGALAGIINYVVPEGARS